MFFTTSDIVTIFTCACAEADKNPQFAASIDKDIGPSVVSDIVKSIDDVFIAAYTRNPQYKRVLMLANIMLLDKKRHDISKCTTSQVTTASELVHPGDKLATLSTYKGTGRLPLKFDRVD